MDTPLTHRDLTRGQGTGISLSVETFADLLLLVDPPAQVQPTTNTLKIQPTSTAQPATRTYLDDLQGLSFHAVPESIMDGDAKQKNPKQHNMKQENISLDATKVVYINHEGSTQVDIKQEYHEPTIHNSLCRLLTSVDRNIQPQSTMQKLMQLPPRSYIAAGDKYEHLRSIKEPFPRATIYIDGHDKLKGVKKENGPIKVTDMSNSVDPFAGVISAPSAKVAFSEFSDLSSFRSVPTKAATATAENSTSTVRTINPRKVKASSIPETVNIRTSTVSGGAPEKEPAVTANVKTRLRPQAPAYTPPSTSRGNMTPTQLPPPQTDSEVPLSDTPALATRTTDAVIADLKGARQARLSSTKRPSAVLPQEEATSQTKIDGLAPIASGLLLPTKLYAASTNEAGVESLTGDEDEDQEILYAARPRKMTERRRIQEAQFSSWYRKRVEELATKEHASKQTINTADDESHSIKWLVAHNENQPIISHAREYQLELFEKAKEKNIIAVLDTGMTLRLLTVGWFTD